LASDILHLLAAAVWLGALTALAILLTTAREGARDDAAALHSALARFSGVGSAVVAVLLATGLVNSGFLVGPSRLGQLFLTPYGVILLAKVTLFAGMLGLAAWNRFRLTPRLEQALGGVGAAVASLRRSVVLESAAGALVLALVSVMGVLAPPSSL
jgi:putative copper resistance protein D